MMPVNSPDGSTLQWVVLLLCTQRGYRTAAMAGTYLWTAVHKSLAFFESCTVVSRSSSVIRVRLEPTAPSTDRSTATCATARRAVNISESASSTSTEQDVSTSTPTTCELSTNATRHQVRCDGERWFQLNPSGCRGNYSATSNDMKLVHWPLMGGLLHLVQWRREWVGPQPSRPLLAVPKKYNSPRINGQCTNHRMIDGPLLSGFYVPIKG